MSWSVNDVVLDKVTWGGYTTTVAVGMSLYWSSEYHKSSYVDGLLGVAQKDASLIYNTYKQLPVIDSLHEQGLISNDFTMCFAENGQGGTMRLGGGSSAGRSFSNVITRVGYTVRLISASVGDDGTNIIASGNTQKAIIDSGTSFLLVPPNVLALLVNAVCSTGACKSPYTAAEIYQKSARFTFLITEEQVAAFPPLVLVLDSGYNFTIEPQRYWLQTALNRHQFVVQSTGYNDVWILGDVVLGGHSILFDRNTSRLGFARGGNCDGKGIPNNYRYRYASMSTHSAPSIRLASLLALLLLALQWSVGL
eukprot:Colp12_sorted_trinity150504_noHs@9102